VADRIKIEITGLRELQRSLKQMDADLPKQIRLILNDASQVIIDYARPRFPTRTGKAVGSLKARSSQRAVRIAFGGKRAPYAPWLDFGGQGRHKGRPALRPFIREGRYLYPGLRVKRDEITQIMERGLVALATGAGFEVD
jgi:hypothetical protein